LLEHLTRIHDDALHLGEYRVMTSSGSSGRKTVFVYDRAAWRGVLVMFLRRSAWVGLKPSLPRTRLAMVGGGVPTHMSRRGAQTLDIGLHRLLSLAVTQPLPELVERLNDFQPNFMNVYPSTAGLLAEEQLAGRLRLRLKGMTTNSEPLTPALRERLETAFGVAPTNFYATTEGLWGHDCEHGSMHLFDDMCIVENVDDDGRPLRLRVALRNGSEGAEERLGERVRTRLAKLGVDRPEVSVERVDALERSAGGKLQVVVAER
jgi:phenylacetate-CoA ligase